MERQVTDADFDQLGWHDNTVYGLRIDVGDPDRGDWHANLVVDLDYIVEWVCERDGCYRFRVAPATLCFHEVSNLRITIDYGASGGQTVLHTLSIDRIDRERVTDQNVRVDRPYWRWRIAFNWPQGGEIAFGAGGFTQRLRAAPVLLDGQHLSPADRV